MEQRAKSLPTSGDPHHLGTTHHLGRLWHAFSDGSLIPVVAGGAVNVEVVSVTPELPTLLTISETARELRVAKSTAAALVARGDIESVIVGERSRRVPRESLLAYIDSLRGE
ncbi:helix-turn-helix domain-containing protein [Actinomadura sp. KC345]|uniref:helix-turn-helix domain-containing protein n=1 Tax=Actinomadura sp. KC345 TaxID=2530371 RepID=UPI001A9D7616|nr:helix-turn-helix domain-containing protein [Actinomadura sp. KC345]